MLRAYARFLQQVKNDPGGSQRYATLADKTEEQHVSSGQEGWGGARRDWRQQGRVSPAQCAGHTGSLCGFASYVMISAGH